MRIILILSIAHTNKLNAYFIGLSLPLFSFIFSGHPVFPKFFLVIFELSLNVWFFYFIIHKFKKYLSLQDMKTRSYVVALAVLSSIILSKLIYYAAKYILISSLIVDSELISTPIYIQLSLAFILSIYMWVLTKRNNFLQ